jgi:hypothetical protein
MDCPYIPLTFRTWDRFAWFKLMKDESKSKVERRVMKVLTCPARLSYCHRQPSGLALARACVTNLSIA